MTTFSEAFADAIRDATRPDDAFVADIRAKADRIAAWHAANPNSDSASARLPEPQKAFDLRLVDKPE